VWLAVFLRQRLPQPFSAQELRSRTQPRPSSFLGLLLHDVTMAGLQELRFPEEKPLLRGQDATELVSRPFLSWGRVRHLVARRETAPSLCGLATLSRLVPRLENSQTSLSAQPASLRLPPAVLEAGALKERFPIAWPRS
jgi:hypothetical protein